MSALEQRIERMKKQGIPMPITQAPMNEGSASAVPVTSKNQDKHARLAALKSGANRQKIQGLVKANGTHGQNGFQGIPEPKVKKNPNHPGNKLSDPSMAVKPQSFNTGASSSSEFNAMEAMYGGGNERAAVATQQPVLNGNSQPQLQTQQNGYGPTFDPVAMMNQKKAMEAQSNQPQQGYDYKQHAVNPQTYQPQGEQQIQQENHQQGQQQFNFQYMQQMMQEIAKQTISEVLSEYTEKSKKGLTYENVKTKGEAKVIKTQDGKYYKLTPVTLTKG